jgi:hypothetical protein
LCFVLCARGNLSINTTTTHTHTFTNQDGAAAGPARYDDLRSVAKLQGTAQYGGVMAVRVAVWSGLFVCALFCVLLLVLMCSIA